MSLASTPDPQMLSVKLPPVHEGDYLSVRALLDFCTLAPERLAEVRTLAAPEAWGEEDATLLRYLAVHVPLAIEQGRYLWSDKELILRAGQLETVAGAPLYLGLARSEGERFELLWAGPQPERFEPLPSADLGPWPTLHPWHEVVVALDLFRSSELAGLPLVAQNAAVSGAVVWSLRRGLAVRQLRGASRGYFVPVHLTNRDAAPELVAPLQIQARRIVVRALLAPRVAYATARAVVERRENLQAWLRAVWEPTAPADEPVA